jgi:hypothetical protein
VFGDLSVRCSAAEKPPCYPLTALKPSIDSEGAEIVIIRSETHRTSVRSKRARFVAPVLSAGLITGMALAVGAGPASASVVSVGGQVIVGPPVPSVTQGAHENDTDMTFFAERTGVTLPASGLNPQGSWPVDISAPPATYGQSYTVNDLPSGSIPAGTKVDSYMLYSDPVGQPTTPRLYTATITFSAPILGVEVTVPQLNATDTILGAPGTTYSKVANSGLDALPKPPEGDYVELANPDTILVHVATTTDIDMVRIITAASGPVAPPPPQQYTEVATDGGVFNFGSQFYGSMGGSHLNQPIVGAAVPTGRPGYWEVARDGGIFNFGPGAPFLGSTGGMHLNQPIVGMASAPDGLGYWLVATDGGIFSFGHSLFHGSTGNVHLNKPIVGMAATPDGRGYWLVASDGGIFNFGDAHFYGSTGAKPLNKPIVGMVPTPDGKGYWLVATDGGIFSFGDAKFHGSTGAIVLNKPIVGMKATASGLGYWLFASDGGVFNFGDAHFLGSMGGTPLNSPIVAGI